MHAEVVSQSQSGGLVTITYDVGYRLILLLFIIATVYQFLHDRRRRLTTA
jgi:hypothetical protein